MGSFHGRFLSVVVIHSDAHRWFYLLLRPILVAHGIGWSLIPSTFSFHDKRSTMFGYD